jgi:ribosomal-protein-alanine N-acetyltransferase
MQLSVLTTPRLILRHWRDDDVEPFIKMNADAEVMRYFPSTQTPEETLTLIARIKAHFTDYGYGPFAVERKDNGRFIGFTGLFHPTFKSHFTPCVEIGWRLSKENWRQGFATEAAKACLQHGFTDIGLKEIYSFTAKLNLPSINVMKKTGMNYMGEFEHPNLADGHVLKTHVLYKIEA